MNKYLKKSMALVLTVLVTLLSLPVQMLTGYADSVQEKLGTKDYNVNLVFVIDASGSMLDSDPSKNGKQNMVQTAMQRFADESNRETSKIGFVLCTDSVEKQVPLSPLSTSMDKLSSEINSLKYVPGGYTDMAVGLASAAKMFEGETGSNKNAIVLLSDGNTELPPSGRKVSDSDKEIAETTANLKKKGIGIYTIGLNYDGSLNTKYMEDIASQTGAIFREAKKSEQIPEIVDEIFVHLIGTDIPDPIQFDNGKGEFDIDSSAVFYAVLTISGVKPVENIHLYTPDPGSFDYPIDNNDNVVITRRDNYTMLKLFYPQVGKWTITFDNANDDDFHCTIIKVYSMTVDQRLSTSIIEPGETVTVLASLVGEDGIVDETDTLSRIKAETVVQGPDTEETLDLNFDGDSEFASTFTLNAEGSYRVFTRMVPEDGSFDPIVSQPKTVTVAKAEYDVSQYVSPEHLVITEKDCEVEITLSLVNKNTYEILSDKSKLGDYNFNTFVKLADADDTEPVKVDIVDGKGTFKVERAGKYIVTTETESISDGTALNKVENEFTAELTAPIVKAKTISMNVRTSPFKISDSKKLSNYLNWDPEGGLDVEVQPGSSDFCELDVEKKGIDFIITADGLKKGSQDYKLICTDEQGHKLELTVYVTVKSGSTVLLLVIALVAAGLLLIYVIYLMSRPKFKSLSYDVSYNAKDGKSSPVIRGSVPINKHSCTLYDALYYKTTTRGDLLFIINNDYPFMQSAMKKIKLVAVKNIQDIKIIVPASVNCRVDNSPVGSKSLVKTIGKKSPSRRCMITFVDSSDENNSVSLVIKCPSGD